MDFDGAGHIQLGPSGLLVEGLLHHGIEVLGQTQTVYEAVLSQVVHGGSQSRGVGRQATVGQLQSLDLASVALEHPQVHLTGRTQRLDQGLVREFLRVAVT